MTLKVSIDIFGLTKGTIYCKKNVPVLVPVFLHAVNMLNFQIKIIISSEKWFNNVVTFLFFFFWKMPKNWVGRTTLNGEKKKRMAITRIKSSSNLLIFLVCFLCVCVLFSVVFTHLVLSLLAVVPAMF